MQNTQFIGYKEVKVTSIQIQSSDLTPKYTNALFSPIQDLIKHSVFLIL